MNDALSATFAALADPTRRALLGRLAKKERSVSELAEPFAMSLPAVSKHLKVLERAGLIERRRDAQRRPCRLRTAPLKEATQWLQHYRRFWEEGLDRLERHLRALEIGDVGGAKEKPRRNRRERTERRNSRAGLSNA
ncbi:MAG: winged helix-turn-helix transcriptional regulator [Planctomycetaceae bacterium]|nr:winged helix-turn-helix transcriptional regulator [Planctomycetaceae bacterium]